MGKVLMEQSPNGNHHVPGRLHHRSGGIRRGAPWTRQRAPARVDVRWEIGGRLRALANRSLQHHRRGDHRPAQGRPRHRPVGGWRCTYSASAADDRPQRGDRERRPTVNPGASRLLADPSRRRVRRPDAVMSEYTPPTPVEGFLDPDDPILFPRLTAAQIEQLAERAETLSLSPGEIVFEQGQREAPLYVVLSGAIDVIDRQPEGDRYFTQCRPGTFAADTSMFTGEPTIARGVAAEETTVLVVPPDALRELLERNLIPFGWHDIDTDAESRALLERLGIGPEECPVLVRTHNVLRRPTVTQVADELGLRAQVDQRTFDVVVLGAGPAGLATAVYASSEGLSTLVIEHFAPGGQAGTSDRIENYLGFPTGLSGSDLTERATLQAWKFGAVISSAHEGCRFSVSESDGLRPLVLADGQRVRARFVVLAVGADYRRLPADGAERFEGLGLYYAATHLEALQASGEDVVVVGGGNSTGQAVVNLTSYARRIYLVVRRSLTATMSRYLIDRIEAAENVEIWEG